MMMMIRMMLAMMMTMMMMLAMIYPTFTPASTSSVVSSAFDTSHAPELPPPPAKRLVDALFSLSPIYFHPDQFIFTRSNLFSFRTICSARNRLCLKVCHQKDCMGPKRLKCCAFVVAMQTFLDALQSGYHMVCGMDV